MIPASTIMIVRDSPGLEVLMVERHHQIDFASGALVFPGGKVSKDDFDPRWQERLDGDENPDTRAFLIAGIREAFEESGLVLARPAGKRGKGKPFATPDDIASLHELRGPVADGKASFLETIANANLVLALDALRPFAHWVTPEFMAKRFDTHFFIAEAPAEQSALCDGWETVDACWVEPGAALEQAERGERTIIFPTRMNLEMLGRSKTKDEALTATSARKIVTVMPKVVQDGEEMFLAIPPEAGYIATRERIDPVMRGQVKAG
ncbi:MAG: NUDIX hydrolase [Hyphomonadaceae bacterium]